MTTDWKDQLLNSGLVSRDQRILIEKAAREAEAQVFLDAQARTEAAGRSDRQKEKCLKDIRTMENPKYFRPEAKKLLLLDPRVAQVEEVLRIAYDNGLQRNKKGGTVLIAQLCRLKGELGKRGLSDAERTRLVEKTISKH
ncbi:MAG: hypothetical protein JWN37_309 [Candidatus Nomurabacteria bacterium]|nr:hypothetical protein [Candidatus Nomurabacteria bacterium]